MNSELLGILTRPYIGAAMEELSSAQVTLDHGVAGDAKGNSGKRQVTVLSLEDWELAEQELGHPLDWKSVRRANLLINGINFGPWHAGKILTVGEVRLKIHSTIEPCYRKDRLFPGLKNALSHDWRAGVACEVLTPGCLSVGDKVTIK